MINIKNGMYSVKFDNDAFGMATVITVIDNKFYGGDISFYYKGEFFVDDDYNLSGNFFVSKWNNNLLVKSLVGLDQYDAKVYGVVKNKVFKLTCTPLNYPNRSFTVTVNRVCNI